MKPVWKHCKVCLEDFVCDVHDTHVYDCECPPIDVWSEFGVSPYDVPKDAAESRLMRNIARGKARKDA